MNTSRERDGQQDFVETSRSNYPFLFFVQFTLKYLLMSNKEISSLAVSANSETHKENDSHPAWVTTDALLVYFVNMVSKEHTCSELMNSLDHSHIKTTWKSKNNLHINNNGIPKTTHWSQLFW